MVEKYRQEFSRLSNLLQVDFDDAEVEGYSALHDTAESTHSCESMLISLRIHIAKEDIRLQALPT